MDVSIDADAAAWPGGPLPLPHHRPDRGGNGGDDGRSAGRLTLDDMLKAGDPAMTIEAIQLEFKEGVRNGVWKR